MVLKHWLNLLLGLLEPLVQSPPLRAKSPSPLARPPGQTVLGILKYRGKGLPYLGDPLPDDHPVLCQQASDGICR
jgi:hypothetical protein